MAIFIDAADYFAALKKSMMEAHESVLLIGWDFDFRIRLNPDDHANGWPDKLGPFLNVLVKRNPKLEIHVLNWDFGMLKTLGRGAMPIFLLRWLARKRVHLHLDRAHPLGASQHQKIVVIDDALAFCGGIDVTVGRWDTRGHLEDDRRRDSPWRRKQGPWHDATIAVDGDAARSLGEWARERWVRATGKSIAKPSGGRDLWPAGFAPTFSDVDVGIARTQPEYAQYGAIHEIEQLYVDAVRSAKQLIYVESQYLASKRIGDELVRRLQESDGPEVIIINPKAAEGWLEEEVMGPARALIVGQLRRADQFGRFRIYWPMTSAGTQIYVHAKIMIVDDHLLKVGSSNINNRSMGLDSECDVAIEVAGHDEHSMEIRNRILGVLYDLVAEHLNSDSTLIKSERRRTGGSLIAAIECLCRPDGRRLEPVVIPQFSNLEMDLAENRILDPERPGRSWRKLWRSLT